MYISLTEAAYLGILVGLVVGSVGPGKRLGTRGPFYKFTFFLVRTQSVLVFHSEFCSCIYKTEFARRSFFFFRSRLPFRWFPYIPSFLSGISQPTSRTLARIGHTRHSMVARAPYRRLLGHIHMHATLECPRFFHSFPHSLIPERKLCFATPSVACFLTC